MLFSIGECVVACNSEPSSVQLISKVVGKKTRPEKPRQKSICVKYDDEFIREALVPKYFKFAKRSVADTLWGRTKPGEGSSSTDSYVQ